MRDLKGYTQYQKERARAAKEKTLSRILRKEVEIGNGGTQNYVIKKGPNTGRIASKGQ
tara:strand:- start:484 stop:657 length:174 start_codon:yes stop_codon:yes gene_type:complete